MSEAFEQKKILRKEMRALKNSIVPPLLDKWSDEIIGRLEELELFRLSSVIGIYHSLPDEVRTHSAIAKWSDEKELYLPVVEGSDMRMVRYQADKLNPCGSFGIAEPIPTADNILNKKLDLLIVPGVAFDLEKNRMGRGKGFYDRFLADKSIPYIIGICFDFQLLPHIPTEPFDRKMDIVITEKRVIK